MKNWESILRKYLFKRDHTGIMGTKGYIKIKILFWDMNCKKMNFFEMANIKSTVESWEKFCHGISWIENQNNKRGSCRKVPQKGKYLWNTHKKNITMMVIPVQARSGITLLRYFSNRQPGIKKHYFFEKKDYSPWMEELWLLNAISTSILFSFSISKFIFNWMTYLSIGKSTSLLSLKLLLPPTFSTIIL